MSQVCKETDKTSRETFHTEFEQMRALIPVPPLDDKEKVANYGKAMEWLNKLYGKREQWAARWTWEHHTAGESEQIAWKNAIVHDMHGIMHHFVDVH